MSEQQTCPHCGAAIHEASGKTAWYECKTMEWYVHSERAERISEECYKRQLAQKDEEIQRVLAANTDCIAWFEDGRDEAIKLKAEFNEALEALRNLVNDSQHKDHDCGDTPDHCPVLAARAIVKKYGKR